MREHTEFHNIECLPDELQGLLLARPGIAQTLLHIRALDTMCRLGRQRCKLDSSQKLISDFAGH